jgi:hypothetical protein
MFAFGHMGGGFGGMAFGHFGGFMRLPGGDYR